MDYAEISVDPKFHRHLIGKGGVNSKYSVAVVLMCNEIWILKLCFYYYFLFQSTASKSCTR